MTPARWHRISEVLSEALEREPHLRGAFLSEACGSDCQLMVEVESLLTAFEKDPGFLEKPAIAELPADAWAALDPEHRVQDVGAYRLIRPIGSGGMGTVYLAERCDAAYVKQVAVKILRTELYEEPNRYQELLRRFQLERQTLANLDHPNIARLLDGGTTAEGVPFLVMEYVQGRPIDRYCHQGRLSIRQRLELFLTVCSAVEHAHRNLVVHRDLKPSNVLVSQDGQPKLVDFGIAKLLENPADARNPSITRTGACLLTPSYASPEQIRGQRVTTASDVYSLGVILYELLSGVHPFEAGIRTPHELPRIICEREPDKPSAVRTSAGTTDVRRLAGDLDTIILKALRKEPERRYPTVGQLSEDIRRHLAGLPVMARADTLRYRASKFVRRHAVGTAAGFVICALLIGGVVSTAWSAHEARRQRDRARDLQLAAEAHLARAKSAERESAVEAESARQVANYLVSIFKSADPIAGPGDEEPPNLNTTAAEILKRAAEQVESSLKDQPEVQARLFHTLGIVYRNLGAYEDSEALLKKALTARRRTSGEANLQTAASLAALGTVVRLEGRFEEAERLLRSALEVRSKCLGPTDPLIAESLLELARCRADRGEIIEAENLYRRTVAIYRSRHPENRAELAEALSDLAAVLTTAGRQEDAERCHREAVDLLREIHGREHPDVASGLTNLANCHHQSKDYHAAEELYREALDIFRRSLPEGHPFVAAGLTNLAGVLEAQGKANAAIPLHRQALDVMHAAYRPGHPQLASGMNNLAMALQATGRTDEAEAAFRAALDVRREALGSDHPLIALSSNNLALLLFRKRDFVEAEQLFREALAIRRAKLDADHPKTVETLLNMATTLRAMRRYEDAESCYRDALASQRRMRPANKLQAAATMVQLGLVLRAMSRFPESADMLEDALTILRTSLPPEDWRPAEATVYLGECLVRLGEYQRAEPLLVDAYKVFSTSRGPRDRKTARALRELIDLYDTWGKPERSATYRALLPSASASP